MQRFIILFFLLAFASSSSAQSARWIRFAAGGSSDQLIGSVILPDSSIVVTGSFEDSVWIGAQRLLGYGSVDGFLARFDQRGNLLWARAFGGPQLDRPASLALGPLDELYLTGDFSQTAQFGSASISSADRNAFVARCSPDGSFRWVKNIGGPRSDLGLAIAADAHRIYATGYTLSDTCRLGDTSLVNGGFAELWLARFDTAGEAVWAQSAGAGRVAQGTALALGPEGTVYLAGAFSDSMKVPRLYARGGTDGFVAAFDSTGSLRWGRRIGGPGIDIPRAVIAGIPPFVYTTGQFSDSLAFGASRLRSAGSYDVFLAKFDTLGNEIGADSWGGTRADQGFSLARGVNGTLYVGGAYQSSFVWQDKSVQNRGKLDGFWARLENDGSLRWIRTVSGPEEEAVQTLFWRANHLIAGGYISQSAQFDSLLPAYTSTGREDGWLGLHHDTTPDLTPPISHLTGRIYHDSQRDCQRGVEDIPLPLRLVRIDNHFVRTDSAGNFSTRIDTGRYRVWVPAPRLPQYTDTSLCPSVAGYAVDVKFLGDTVAVPAFYRRVATRGKLRLALAAGPHLPCETARLSVWYFNEGADTLVAPQVELFVPSGTKLVRDTLPIRYDRGAYVLSLDDLPPQSGGILHLRDSVSCGSSIRPGSFRVRLRNTSAQADWLRVSCLRNDTAEVSFRAKAGDSLFYRLYLDELKIYEQRTQIGRADSNLIRVKTSGQSLRIVAQKTGDVAQSVSLSGCATAGQPTSPNFDAKYDLVADKLHAESVWLRDTRDTLRFYALPEGRLRPHFISPTTRIHYRLSYRNSGGDTISTFQFIDTLPPTLDPASVQESGGSHPYRIEFLGSGQLVLRWVFTGPIPPGETAWVAYSVQPIRNIPPGTRIEQKAYARAAASTIQLGTSYHTIWQLDPGFWQPQLVQHCVRPLAAEAGRDTLLCGPDSLRLSGSFTGSGRWKLTTAGGKLVSPDAPSLLFKDVPRGISRIVLNATSCDATVSDTVQVMRDTIPVAPAVIPKSDTLCSGDSLQLIGPSGYAAYFWNGTSGSNVYKVNRTGTYRLVVATQLGCQSPASNEADIYFATPPPAPQLIAQNDTLFAVHTGAKLPRWQWFDATGIIAGADRAFFVPGRSDSFRVMAAYPSGCRVESDWIFARFTGISSHLSPEQFSFGPNPARRYLRVRWTRGANRQLRLYDNQGRAIAHWLTTKSVEELALPDLPPGCYYLQVHGEADVYFAKIMVAPE